MDVILFGPPGAGKGTQASAVVDACGALHLSTGDIFRKHLREGTELGLLAKKFMAGGGLVPDDVVVRIVTSRLGDEDAKSGVLFDGFPRTVRQAELFVDWLVANGREVGVAVNLVVADEVVVGRLSGRRTCSSCGATYHVDHNPPAVVDVCDRCGGPVVQRDDDSVETVKKRIEAYHAQTAPVLDWLRERVPVVDVDADRPIADVRNDVVAAVS